jgi:DNA-binding NarL/FixJ family response regulator
VLRLRVAVVSEDPLARSGVAARLEREGVAVAAELAPGEVATPGTELADAVVVDLASEAALDAVRASPVPVVALLADDGQAGEALAAGARALVLRSSPADRIAAAVGAVVHGLAALDAPLAPVLLRPPPVARAGGELTPRETEVLAELAEGRSNKEIARALGISERTAKFHVESILAKLGAEGRSEAIVLAARLGLVTL